MSRLPCKDYLEGTCTTPFCEKWHPSEYGCRFGDKCSYLHRQVDEQPSKRSQKNGDKSAVAMLDIKRQLGCVYQDMEPPKSSSILRKSSNIRKPIRWVQFTKAVVRHANIRHQNPSIGMICPGDPHQRNPNAPRFEDRSQEETEWQERCAREGAWKLVKNIQKLKEKDKTAFFSPSENRCLPAPSTLKPEEGEFVVDSGASMHMISKKVLSSAELETLTTSRSATTVITAIGEVQTQIVLKKLDQLSFQGIQRGISVQTDFFPFSIRESSTLSNSRFPLSFNNGLSKLEKDSTSRTSLPMLENRSTSAWVSVCRNVSENKKHQMGKYSLRAPEKTVVK